MFGFPGIRKLLTITLILTGIASLDVNAQSSDRNLIQLSGMVTTLDTTNPVPFATIRVKNERRGTAANLEGFYTLVVNPGDTLEFSAMGFSKALFAVPDDIDERRHRHLQPLAEDTLLLEEQVVFPWPTKSQFKRAVLNLDLQDDYREQAQENLRREILREMNRSLAMDGREAQTMEMQRISHEFARAGGQQDFYMTQEGGTPVPSSLLDPTAWYELIQSIQRGDFSTEDE